MEIARVYFDVDMRLGFQGLTVLAVKKKYDPRVEDEKRMVVFMNRACTKFKLLVSNQYLVYYNNGSRRIPLEAISHLPTFFDGKKLTLDRAIAKTIINKLGTPA